MEKLQNRNADSAEELLIGQQQVESQCGVNLDPDSVLGCSDKYLDAQVLLDLLEKQLYLPAVLIDVGDGLGSEFEIVGQKFKKPLAVVVKIFDASQFQRLSFSNDFNDVITFDRSSRPNRSSLDFPMGGVGLQASDEENTFPCQFVKPAVVVVAAITDHYGAFGQL